MRHFADLRQELAVRERQQEVTRKSAPSSPTLDCEKMDSAVQASLSLPATPVGKGTENSFPSPKGLYFLLKAMLDDQFQMYLLV